MCVFVCMQIEIIHIIIREWDPVIVKIQVNLSVPLVNYYPGRRVRHTAEHIHTIRPMMKKHWEHRHMEMTLVRPTRGTRTPLIQPNIRYTQETTIDTHIKPKYSPTLHSDPEPRPVQVYSYIYLCIYIDLCLYKYQFKGFEELQVHFHEQYLKQNQRKTKMDVNKNYSIPHTDSSVHFSTSQTLLWHQCGNS